MVMVKQKVKNSDKLWGEFEKTGSIAAFLTYQQTKQDVVRSKGRKPSRKIRARKGS